MPICWIHCQLPIKRKKDCSSSGALGDQCNKQTCVDSLVVKVRSEHSSTKDNEDIHKLEPEARPRSEPQGQEPTSPPSSPTKATADLGDHTVVGTLRSTGNHDIESNANCSEASCNGCIQREHSLLGYGVSLWGLFHMFGHR